jgi:hypothetical protein
MTKHKSIIKDELANRILNKHPKIVGFYYKGYDFKNDNGDTEVRARIQRRINKEKLYGHLVESNSDEIMIWDKRGDIRGYEYGNGDYTGDNEYPFLKLSVRTNRKDLGLLEYDIDFAIKALENVKKAILKDKEV